MYSTKQQSFIPSVPAALQTDNDPSFCHSNFFIADQRKSTFPCNGSKYPNEQVYLLHTFHRYRSHQIECRVPSKSHNQEKMVRGTDRKPSRKKSKPNDDRVVIRQAWQHFCDYCFTNDDDDEEVEKEADQLEEILDLIQRHIPDALTEVWELPPTNTNHDDVSTHWNLRKLLPLLISVTLTLLADQCIAEFMTLEAEKLEDIPTTVRDDAPTHRQQRKRDLLQTIRQYLTRALRSYPSNAAAWQMATNYLRMTSSCSAAVVVAQLYVAAADRAATIRQVAIEFLSQHPPLPEDEEVQEWVATLLLNQVCGVDEVDDDDVEEKEDDDEDEAEDGIVVWSSSKVEGISRYMACMMCSMIQQHDVALEQLQLLGITHRLHPHLWQTALPRPRRDAASSDPMVVSEQNSPSTTPAPVSFRPGKGDTGGVIPQHLFDRLCHLFQPDADYWSRSEYSTRGYFSFYEELPKHDQTQSSDSHHDPARNLIDDIVRNYLLPLIQQSDKYQTNNDKEEMVGYEWWVHTRATTANLGHNLHFDTDEALLRRDGTVSHPLISSVLYLTGGGDNAAGQSHGGPTIIFDQTPDSTSNADQVWYSHPINNSFMIFPGNLLHGVLPCSGPTTIDDNAQQIASSESLTESLINLLSNESTPDKPEPAKTVYDSNRLTLMIGFWTRNVPADMDPELSLEDRLYGPCSPLPSIDDTPWVRELCAGYENSSSSSSDTTDAPNTPPSNVVSVPLPCVSPAWEEITKVGDFSTAKVSTASTALSIPRDVDHRFFVIDAPACFKSQLMEGQYSDDAAVYYYTEENDDDDDDK